MGKLAAIPLSVDIPTSAPRPPVFFLTSLGIVVSPDFAKATGFHLFETEHGRCYLWDQVKNSACTPEERRQYDAALEHCKVLDRFIRREYIIRGHMINGYRCNIFETKDQKYIIVSELKKALLSPSCKSLKIEPDSPGSRSVFFSDKGKEWVKTVITLERALDCLRESKSDHRFRVIKDIVGLIEQESLLKDEEPPEKIHAEVEILEKKLRLALYDGKILIHGGDLAVLMDYKHESKFARRKFDKVYPLSTTVFDEYGHLCTTSANYLDIEDVERYLKDLGTEKAKTVLDALYSIKK